MLGNFENASIDHFGITSKFYRRDEKFFARTDGPDGKLKEYEIAYTFGVFPLQQYLIAFLGGRLQALGIAWDTARLRRRAAVVPSIPEPGGFFHRSSALD